MRFDNGVFLKVFNIQYKFNGIYLKRVGRGVGGVIQSSNIFAKNSGIPIGKLPVEVDSQGALLTVCKKYKCARL